jgi:hypothetical protein
MLQRLPSGAATNAFLKRATFRGCDLPPVEKIQFHAPTPEDAGQKPFPIATGVFHASSA